METPALQIPVHVRAGASIEQAETAARELGSRIGVAVSFLFDNVPHVIDPSEDLAPAAVDSSKPSKKPAKEPA